MGGQGGGYVDMGKGKGVDHKKKRVECLVDVCGALMYVELPTWRSLRQWVKLS